MSANVRELLAEAGADMPPARLAADTWQRGRRARRRGRLRATMAAVMVLGLLVVADPVIDRADRWLSADDAPTVPGDLDLPWMWQATVYQDPPGPASVLYGGDTMGLNGTDIFDHEGKLAVVGRDGDTRMLLYSGFDSVRAGEEVLLSPDGGRVAHMFVALPDVQLPPDGLIITDLTSGRSSAVGRGTLAPVAWAPDGGTLLVSGSTPGERWRYGLLELASGQLTPVGEEHTPSDIRSGSRAAFAPDSRHVAVSDGQDVTLYDRQGQPVWTRELDDWRYLAGVGAFTPDGTRIVTVTVDGCRVPPCGSGGLAGRRWTFGYLDAATGADTGGPTLPVVTGSAVRALGWSQGRELVVLRYEPETRYETGADEWTDDTGWYETNHVTLIGLSQDGTTRVLLDPPSGVLDLDVAADLLQAGRFDGPSSHASMFPARMNIFWISVGALGCVVLVATLVLLPIALAVRRRRRGHRAAQAAALVASIDERGSPGSDR